MHPEKQLKSIVIIGGGPVGNFAAVLSKKLGIPTTVYEKRSDYTRQINVKITEGFFKATGELFQRLSRSTDSFFIDLDKQLEDRKFKTKLNVLETRLKEKAVDLGVKYTERDIKDYDQVRELHKGQGCLFLDCAGRRSPIRISEFGPDDKSMQIYDLQSAMHINFKAKVDKLSALGLLQLIYPVFKTNPHIKVGQIVISKSKDEKGYSHVTIPLMIEKQLANEFDKHFPDINRVPLKFFQSDEKREVPQILSMAITSVFYPLIIQDWDINWRSVVVKKIQITCGYAKERSRKRLVCLGDSAAHFAYYRSLNIGLSHTAKFFEMLTEYSQININVPTFSEEEVKAIFKKANFLLVYHSFAPSIYPCKYFITTKAVVYGAYTLDLRSLSAKKLDLIPCVSQQKAKEYFRSYEEDKTKKESWKKWLQKYEQWRMGEIKGVVSSNSLKNNSTNLVSTAIWLNSISPISISETVHYLKKGYYLGADDFKNFNQLFIGIKRRLQNEKEFIPYLLQKIEFTKQFYEEDLPNNLKLFFEKLELIIVNHDFSWQLLKDQLLSLKWEKKNYNCKLATSLVKSLQICLSISMPMPISSKIGMMKEEMIEM